MTEPAATATPSPVAPPASSPPSVSSLGSSSPSSSSSASSPRSPRSPPSDYDSSSASDVDEGLSSPSSSSSESDYDPANEHIRVKALPHPLIQPKGRQKAPADPVIKRRVGRPSKAQKASQAAAAPSPLSRGATNRRGKDKGRAMAADARPDHLTLEEVNHLSATNAEFLLPQPQPQPLVPPGEHEGTPMEVMILFDEVARTGEAVCYKSFELAGRRYFVGDYVYLRAPMGDPYVAILQRIWHPQSSNLTVYCDVRWFYRPEDTHMGRTSDVEKDELFESTHVDVNAPESICGRCLILSESEYARYRKKKKKAELLQIGFDQPLDVYFCRKGYNPSKSKFYKLLPKKSVFANMKFDPAQDG